MEEYLKYTSQFRKKIEGTQLSRRGELYLLFRMAGPIMQAKLPKLIDLDKIPKTFIHGNPHLDNYVRTFKGSAMVDFDRSRIGPYCWDLVRFLSSLSLRREKREGFLDKKVVEHFIDAYFTHLLNPEIPAKTLKMLREVKPQRWQMTTKDYIWSNKKWSKKMKENPLNGKSEFVQGLVNSYLKSRNEEKLLDKFKIEEAGEALGSFGKKHYIISLTPRNSDSHEDIVLLDIKQVYQEKNSKYFYSPFNHHGVRMIEASKIFAPEMEERLGFCTFQSEQYWGRQVPSFAVKVKKYLNLNEQCDFAYSVGSQLAKGHAKGVKNSADVEVIEKDFVKNFDKYYKISKFLTFELILAYQVMKRKIQLENDFRSW
jgi:uncharacterized protein (DUF2252 family)